MRRVVITGAGTINALGVSVAQTLDAFSQGRCGIGPLSLRDVDRLGVQIGAQVRDYDETAHFTLPQIALYDRFTQFTLLAAAEAVAHSGLSLTEEESYRAGVIMGTAGGGLNTQDDNYRAVYQDGKNRVHPFVVPRLMANSAVSHVSMTYGLRGPSYTVSTACASSNHAMAQAFQMVRSGAAPVMLTGGAEAMLCFGGIKAWEGLRVMSRDTCRPFSANRSGMVQGEGAAVFVFEDYDRAVARGADILAEVVGAGMSSDAGDIVTPSADGAARAMMAALHDAQIAPEAVGYINAHGTATTANDKTECAAIRQAYGAHADHLMVSSTKSMHAHLIGGTGAVELLACIMALRDGVIAPTVNYETPDPECKLDIVPNEARRANISVAASNAFAFGGLNCVLVLRKI